MEQALADFFAAVAEGNYAYYYRPYDLAPETASRLCNSSGEDLNYVLIDEGIILGHGMLRGWDEGYAVPSLGIVIHPDTAGKSLGTMLTGFLHSVAWLRDCQAVRLTVYKNNIPAVKIYKRFGYKFTDKNNEEYVGILQKKKRNETKP